MFNPANYWQNIGMGGYVYAYSDATGSPAGTSSICVNGTAFCASGSTGVSSSSTWGAGAGINLNELPGASTPGTYMVPSSKAGVSYTLSSLPSGTVYLMIDNSGTAYYATLTAASGMVPWSSFKTTPWQPDASAPLGSAPSATTHVQFQVSAGSSANSFSFCVTALSFY